MKKKICFASGFLLLGVCAFADSNRIAKDVRHPIVREASFTGVHHPVPLRSRPQFHQFIGKKLDPAKIDRSKIAYLGRGAQTKKQPKLRVGRRGGGARPLIVGGSVYTGDAPWIVALIKKNPDGTSMSDPYDGQFCGGSLISPQFILTASHCVVGLNPSSFEILTGTESLEAGKGRRVQVDEILMDAYYNSTTVENDVALIRLAEPLTDATFIELAESDSLYDVGSMVTVLGWGATDSGRSIFPRDLQAAALPIVDFNLANVGWSGALVASMLPTGFSSGGIDACGGDSGGPIVKEDSNGVVKLVGVVSFGAKVCGTPGVYGISSRVVSFVDWVESVVTPEFYSWATLHGVFGWNLSTDPSGLTNLMQYALGADPGIQDSSGLGLGSPFFYDVQGTSSRQAAVRLLRRRSGEVDYSVSTSPDLSPDWTAVSSSDFIDVSSVTGHPEFEEVSALGQVDAGMGFFKNGLNLGSRYVPFLRWIRLGANSTSAEVVSGSLQSRDLPYTATEARYYRDYSIVDLPVTSQILQIDASSSQVNLKVQLLDSKYNVLLEEVASGSSVSLAFSSVAGEAYIVRVTSQSLQETGDFTVTAYSQ